MPPTELLVPHINPVAYRSCSTHKGLTLPPETILRNGQDKYFPITYMEMVSLLNIPKTKGGDNLVDVLCFGSPCFASAAKCSAIPDHWDWQALV